MKRLLLVLCCLSFTMAFANPALADRDRGHDRDYRGHHGYRDRPYDRHRHYDHKKYRKHEYAYRGHWRSWADWDNYRRAYPRIYQHGHYYYEGAHLMFRFCDPDSGSCFFFSIGR